MKTKGAIMRFFPDRASRGVLQYASTNIRNRRYFWQGSPLESYYKVNVTPNIIKSLESIDSSKSEIHQKLMMTNGNLKKSIQDKLRYSWTYHSNAIEGNRLTLVDTIFFLKEGLTVSGKPLKDFLDTKNHSEAIEYIFNVVTKR